MLRLCRKHGATAGRPSTGNNSLFYGSSISPQFALVRRSIGVNHGLVERTLVGRILAYNGSGEFLSDMACSLRDAFPAVTLLIAVTEFDGLLFSR